MPRPPALTLPPAVTAAAAVAGEQGGLERVVLGAEDPSDLWAYAGLQAKLPPGLYQLQPGAADPDAAALGWLLGGCP